MKFYLYLFVLKILPTNHPGHNAAFCVLCVVEDTVRQLRMSHLCGAVVPSKLLDNMPRAVLFGLFLFFVSLYKYCFPLSSTVWAPSLQPYVQEDGHEAMRMLVDSMEDAALYGCVLQICHFLLFNY